MFFILIFERMPRVKNRSLATTVKTPAKTRCILDVKQTACFAKSCVVDVPYCSESGPQRGRYAMVANNPTQGHPVQLRNLNMSCVTA